MKSRAAVFYRAGQPLEARDVELDEPRPTDVVVRMSVVGICAPGVLMKFGLCTWLPDSNEVISLIGWLREV